jgi:hypothetical protein
MTLDPTSDAAKAARAKTKGGAIKLAANCGIIFRHKDRKRGQQDTLRWYFDNEFGFNLCFPDTNNTRFQSHEEACAVLVTYLDFFIEFLDYVRDNKKSRQLNHLEANVYKGLRCEYTLHELCAVTMYYVAVSVPYMRSIRSSKHSPSNVLDLGPLHHALLAFLDKLIADPDLLIGPNPSHITGTFDGLPWSHPKAVEAVQRYKPQLPHLSALLVALLRGACKTWKRFTAEYADDSPIARATAEQRERAWMDKTNDPCESEFGIYRQAARRNPNISLSVHNSREMYARNRTAAYLKKCSPAMRKFLRRVAREEDDSGANARARRAIIQVRKVAAEVRAEKAAQNLTRKKARAEKQARVVPILTVTEAEYRAALPSRTDGYLKVEEIDAQLQWLHDHGVSCVPKVKNQRGKGRAERITLWLRAVSEYVASGADRSPEVDEDNVPDEDIHLDEETAILSALEEEFDNGYDSEEDFYGNS